MFTPFRTRGPLTVVVSEGRWDSFGHITPSNDELFLNQLLTDMGGVNESVPPGTYHFTAKWRPLKFQFELSLLPAPADN